MSTFKALLVGIVLGMLQRSELVSTVAHTKIVVKPQVLLMGVKGFSGLTD